MNQPKPLSADVSAAAPKGAKDAPDAGWFAAVAPIVLIALCGELGISVLNNSALPVYFTRGLHLTTRAYGAIMAMFFVSEVLFKSPLGALADKIGRKPLMLLGTALTVFTPLVLISMRYNPASATAAAVVIGFGFLRAVDGLGAAAMWPSLYAYVGDVVAESRRGAAMGVLNLVYMIGIAFSFLAGGFVDDTFGPVLTHQSTLGRQVHRALVTAGHHLRDRLRHVHAAPAAPAVPPIYQPEYYFPSFCLTSLLFAVAVIAGLSLRAKARVRAGGGGGAAPEEEGVTWAGFVAAVRTAPQFLLVAFVMFAGIGCISALVKKFALDEFHVTETAFGQLVLGPALLIGLFAVPAGGLADRWGKAHCVQLGFGLAAAGLWGIPVLHHVFRHDLAAGQVAFIGAATVMGAGSVIAFPAWLAMLTSLCGEDQRGTVFGAVSTAQGVGALAGLLAGTALYDVSHLAPFLVAASLVTAATLLALLFVRAPASAGRQKPAADS